MIIWCLNWDLFNSPGTVWMRDLVTWWPLWWPVFLLLLRPHLGKHAFAYPHSTADPFWDCITASHTTDGFPLLAMLLGQATCLNIQYTEPHSMQVLRGSRWEICKDCILWGWCLDHPPSLLRSSSPPMSYPLPFVLWFLFFWSVALAFPVIVILYQWYHDTIPWYKEASLNHINQTYDMTMYLSMNHNVALSIIKSNQLTFRFTYQWSKCIMIMWAHAHTDKQHIHKHTCTRQHTAHTNKNARHR